MRHLELADEAVQRARLFQGIQILALDIFDQRHRHGGFIVDTADQRRNFVQARHLRGTPAALTSDDFVTARLSRLTFVDRPHDDRLHQPLRADGVRQLLQAFRPHVDAWLVLAPLQQVDRNFQQFFIGAQRRNDGGLRSGHGLSEQCSQSTAEAGSFGRHDDGQL